MLTYADNVWTQSVPQSFKSVVVESIKELVKEIETIKEHVADQAYYWLCVSSYYYISNVLILVKEHVADQAYYWIYVSSYYYISNVLILLYVSCFFSFFTLEHVHADEVILTCGYCNTVLSFSFFSFLQAMEHVHANEVILTCGYSNTVLHFLMEVARRYTL